MATSMLSTSTWNVDASYKSVKSYREQYRIVIDVVPRPTSSFNRLHAPGASCPAPPPPPDPSLYCVSVITGLLVLPIYEK